MAVGTGDRMVGEGWDGGRETFGFVVDISQPGMRQIRLLLRGTSKRILVDDDNLYERAVVDKTRCPLFSRQKGF